MKNLTILNSLKERGPQSIRRRPCRSLEDDCSGISLAREHVWALSVFILIFCFLVVPVWGAQNAPVGRAQAQATHGSSLSVKHAVVVPTANPARVIYQGGSLTVIANGSSLAKILAQIHAQMGITFKGNVLDDRISGKFGPGIPRDILEELLETHYGYITVGDGTPNSVTKVVLVRHDEMRNQPSGEIANGSRQLKGGSQSAALPKPGIPAAHAAADNAENQVENQQPAMALAAGPDGSPYIGGTEAATVNQAHDSLRQMEQQRSQQLSEGNGNDRNPQ
jgi:hypothetical protein